MASSLNAPPPEPSLAKPTIIDDKSPHCIPFILSHLQNHLAQNGHSKPFFVGINGVQGAGKTTLVATLAQTLKEKEGLETLVCSIDDLYLKHKDQVALADAHKDNALVQHRGEPGTHDMHLAKFLIEALRSGQETKIPQYDKSLFSGAGDRAPLYQWNCVNGPNQPQSQVIILEGWCVGFRALPKSDVESRQEQAPPTSTLQKHKLEHLLFVNEKLREYDVITDVLDVFIHIDAQDTRYVYEWRLEQEAMLRREKGAGMTDEEVVRFVDGYYPAYELFTDKLRSGVFDGQAGKQLRLIVGKDRKVKEVVKI